MCEVSDSDLRGASAAQTKPAPDSLIIVVVTIVLVSLGVIMVLSAASANTRSSPYHFFKSQTTAAILGLIAMFVLSRFSVTLLRKLSWLLFGLTLVLLLLVLTPLGVEANGARRWLSLGPINLQPSEIAKLSCVLWSAHIVEFKHRLHHDWRQLAVPYLAGNGLIIFLILLEKDLGTTAILMLIMLSTLFVGGIAFRKLLMLLGGALLIAVVAALFSPNRMVRLMSWANSNCDDGADLCHQGLQGQYALASGGWLGVGPGQSRQKWHWIPEAHTDFIFAIVGEELGLLGSLFILLLFGLLAISLHRIALRATTIFSRCVCSVTLIWLVSQAILNIAMVAGLVPVTGVPLTFISFGGSSLLISLAAIGIVLAIARDTQKEDRQRA